MIEKSHQGRRRRQATWTWDWGRPALQQLGADTAPTERQRSGVVHATGGGAPIARSASSSPACPRGFGEPGRGRCSKHRPGGRYFKLRPRRIPHQHPRPGRLLVRISCWRSARAPRRDDRSQRPWAPSIACFLARIWWDFSTRRRGSSSILFGSSGGVVAPTSERRPRQLVGFFLLGVEWRLNEHEPEQNSTPYTKHQAEKQSPLLGGQQNWKAAVVGDSLCSVHLQVTNQ